MQEERTRKKEVVMAVVMATTAAKTRASIQQCTTSTLMTIS